jgi:phosphatidylglycerol---prolipoprotein diacylglyceryl transferase
LNNPLKQIRKLDKCEKSSSLIGHGKWLGSNPILMVPMFHWNGDPEIFRIGIIAMRWYGLMFMLSFVFGMYILDWIYRKEHKPAANNNKLLAHMLIGALAGARIGHCFFYDPSYYLCHPLEILTIWEGGLASHGAAIGILLMLYFYSKKHPDQPYLWLVDRIAIAVALAGTFIRIGNFFNSEIIGTPSLLPWSVVFCRIDNIARHPAQLYEALAYLVIFLVLLMIYKRRFEEIPQGLLLGLFLVLVFGFRFFVEFAKENQAAFEEHMDLNMGQLLSLPAVPAGLFLVFRAMRK